MRANETCVWNLSNPSLFPVLLCAPSLRSSRVSRLYYFILFSLELENATSACSLQIARQLTDHSRVFIFIHEANLRGISFNLSIILFFFQRNEYRFAPPFFFLRIFVHYFSLKSHVMLLIETKRIFASLECRTWCTRIIKVSAEWSYV